LLSSFAENAGVSRLDNEIEDLLLSDLESKMLEIIQEAKKFMRHSKRDILKTDDIKHAMDKLSIPVRDNYSDN
jgi:transcription initiation factor TFIID subunit 6